MDAFEQRFMESADDLSPRERQAVQQALDAHDGATRVCELIETLWASAPACPHCSDKQVYRHGFQSGLRRYRCRACGRTFYALTGTPLARLHKKELWLDYLNCMVDRRVLREISEQIDISIPTAFHWRHRFCAWLDQDVPDTLNGIVEADETFFRESQKGSRHLTRPAHRRGADSERPDCPDELIGVLTVQDRGDHALEKTLGSGELKAMELEECLGTHMAEDVTVVSDETGAYHTFCLRHHLGHVVVRSQADGIMNLHHVQALHRRMKELVNRHFRGVATKYLNHYVWMLHELEHRRNELPEGLLAAALGKFHYVF